MADFHTGDRVTWSHPVLGQYPAFVLPGPTRCLIRKEEWPHNDTFVLTAELVLSEEELALPSLSQGERLCPACHGRAQVVCVDTCQCCCGSGKVDWVDDTPP